MGEPEPAVRRARVIRIGTFKAKPSTSCSRASRRSVGAVHSADGAFPVKDHSLDSALHSIPDCQIIKKAVVSRLGTSTVKPGLTRSAKVSSQFIMHDVAELYLNLRRRSAQARLPRQQQRGAAP
ncbi:MAG: hypothetical protein ACLSGI_03755 [Butyricicoccaceae bacterium]